MEPLQDIIDELRQMEQHRKAELDSIQLVDVGDRQLKAYITGRYDELVNVIRIIRAKIELHKAKH